MENQSKIFDQAIENICEIGTIEFKKELTKNKEKLQEIAKKHKLNFPIDDFVFRKTKTIRLKKGINPGKHNLENISSSSKIVLLLFKNILFKLNKKTVTAKIITRY